MKEIAHKLISGQIDTLQALLLAREKASGDLKIFIEKELDGYPINEDLPDYRKFSCPIVLDYQTPWGQVYNEVELDTKILNEKKGINVNESLFFDSYSFIQKNVDSLTTDYGIRPFNINMLELFSKIVKSNTPNPKIIGGGHRFQKQQIQSILDTVKIELIKKLQDYPSDIITTPKENKQQESQKISVFVSYAWGSESDNNFVISFVDFLLKSGYDARMDKSESQHETSINFKRMMHDGLYNSDKVVVILSAEYKRKADNLEGGVGEEVKIIQEEISKKTNKYILVSFNHLDDGLKDRILPNSLVDREIIDLKKDQDENAFTYLFSKLNSTPIIDFSEIAESTPEIKKIKIEPFKL